MAQRNHINLMELVLLYCTKLEFELSNIMFKYLNHCIVLISSKSKV